MMATLIIASMLGLYLLCGAIELMPKFTDKFGPNDQLQLISNFTHGKLPLHPFIVFVF